MYCNRAYTDILGYHRDALVDRSCFDIVHPEDRSTAMKLFNKGLTDNFSSDTVHFKLIHADGRFFHVDHQARLIFDSNNTPLVLLNSRDVTRQRQAEELLKKKSNERRLLLDTIPTQIWYLTDIDTYGAVNQAHADFVGRSPKDIAYQKLNDVLPLETVGKCRESNVRVFNTGRPVSTEEWMTHASGERRLIHITRTPKLDEQGRVDFVVCAGNDITEARSLERQFRAIFEKAPVGIEIYDANGKLRAANPKCIELFGIANEKEIAGFNLFDDPNVTEDIKAKLHRGETVYFESPFDFDKVRTAGLYGSTRSGIIHLAVMISLLKPTDRLDFSGYLAIIQDITLKKQYELDRLSYERRIQQLQKAESLGRMAGAIAHHFNNQLQAVIGNLEMAVDELPQESRHLTEALKAAQKAADVSGTMLAYRGQIPGRQIWMDLSDICRRSLPLLQAAAPKQVVIEANLPESGPFLRASSGQIHQAITNMIVNACEAAGDNPNHVVLTVGTVSPERIPVIRRFPIDWEPENIDYACLEVRDTGCGIAEKDIDKIFDPFYSTRFYGRGMGLSVVLGIVGAHAGGIVVESELNRGSIFRIYLPISPEDPPSRLMKTLPTPPSEITGTVLLIDDEEPVRHLTGIMLSRLGLTVMEARDGIEALELFKLHQNDIHCIFSDMTMPGMDGWELLAAVRALSPNIPVILSSGYDESHVLSGEHPEQPDAFLGKPYRFQELRNAVYQALNH
jgi:PAS domain S-box-containing protein